LFVNAFNIISNKNHLSPDGLNKILDLNRNINKGFNAFLRKSFPEVARMEKKNRFPGNS